MRTPKNFYLNFCLILVAITLASGFAQAQTLTASPNSVAFNYVVMTGARNTTANVTISGGTAASVACTGGTFGGQALFRGTPNATGVTLEVNPALVGSSLLTGTYYSGTCTVTGTGGGTVDVAVSYSINNSSSSTLTASPSTLSFNAATVNGTPLPSTATVTVTSTVPMTFSAASDVQWMAVYPTQVTTATTSTTLTVQAGAYHIAGNHVGHITITPTAPYTGTAATVTVNYGVGVASGSLFASPSTMTFDYSTGGAAPLAQTLYIQSSNASITSVNLFAQDSWLKVDGLDYTTKPLAGGAATASITVDPTVGSLNPGTTYQSIINITDGTGGYAAVTVYFNFNTTGTGTMTATPSSLSFSSTSGSIPAQQSVLINGVGTSFTFSTSPSGGWLSAMQSGSSILVNASPSGLTTNTYTGYIYVQSTALSPVQYLQIPVTFYVGTSAGTGTVAGPSSLTFSMQQGGTGPSVQYIAVAGAYGGSYTATVAGANWLVISGGTGTTPGLIGVQIYPSADVANAASYSNAITVTSTYGTMSIPVTLNVSATPVVTFSPSADIALNYLQGSTNPGVQYINLGSSNAGTPFNYTAGSSTSWLSVSPTGGTTPQQIGMVINTTGLPTGINTGYVNITASGAGNPSISIPVVVNVYSTTAFTVSPASLVFNTTQGLSPAAQTFTITTDVSTTYTATATSSGWLSVSPNTGTSPATVTVTVASSGLAAGQHTGTIAVYANGQTQTIPVTLNVGAAAGGTLSVTPATLSFEHWQGEGAPPVQQLQVTSSGSPLTFTATAATSSGSGWLSLDKSGGQTPAYVNVSVNPTGLAAGTYQGTITIASSGATGSPQTVSVTVTVRTPPNLAVGSNSAYFTYRTDSSVPGGQQVRVTSTGTELSFTASSSVGWATVTPVNGLTPADITIAVNPTGLAAGRYTGTVTVSGDGGRTTQTIEVILVVAAPLPTITRVVNAGSGAEGPIAPGEVLTITGDHLGPATKTEFIIDDTDHYAKVLADVKVRVNGIPVPLVYVSASEVRAIATYRLANAKEANVQVDYQGSRSNTVTKDAVEAVPGIFTTDGTGSGPAAAMNFDGSPNSADNPAERGSTVIVIITGDGQTAPDGEDGKINRGDETNSPRPVLPVTATIDGLPANVTFAGGVQGQVAGMTQVRIEVPLAANTGYVPLEITVGSAKTQSNVTIAVK